MQIVIRAPREFWLGILYLVFGGAGAWFALKYPLGTAARMGPGYLPMLISGLLLLFGAISITRALRVKGEAIGGIAYRPMICVLLGVFSFAVLAERAGLIISIIVLALIAAAGSEKFRFEWKAAVGLAGFILFCVLVFVEGLGVPLPLLGTWFGG
jgi:hypothetical protein